ncbi:flagellar filament capping protein FliD [Sedimentibacter sp.]|uniref:flagellar filament capping protein FliD n=1 Tax=Sedimentibacter sp. TaxID=1960295 RepID=UPI00289CC744|nr:flagellar filament capping protein FliD [Sedimentibacter sp.]
MASINSIYGSSTNKGVGGLLSGLDTDDLVEKMTLGTRTKINRQYQSKQKLLYRQQAYREISSKLLAFSDKYLSFSSGSKTNILSSSFFEAYTYKPSDSSVNIAGNAENIKNFFIEKIDSVASAASYTTKKAASVKQSFESGKVYEDMPSIAGDTMTIEHDGNRYSLQISKDFRFSGTNYAEDIAVELNKNLALIKDKNGNKLSDSIEYKAVDGGIEFEKGESKLVAASKDILKAFNIDKIEKDTIASSNGVALETDGLVRSAKEVFLEGSITFDFNGIKKTINLSKMDEKNQDGTPKYTYTYDAEGLKDFLSAELAKAYGNGKINVNVTGASLDSLEFSVEPTDPDVLDTNVLSVSSISGDLSIITGIKAGDSNRLSMSKSIGSIYGDSADLTLDVNGKPITITGNMTVSEIIKKINSESDVNIIYSSTTDTFTINSKETGAHTEINITGGLANLLFKEQISGPKGTDTVMSYILNGQPVTINRSTANFTIDGMSIDLNKSAEGKKDISFDVNNNSDEVVERVKKFIDEYNEIITMIGTKTKEKPSRKYPPLTPDQQEEMNDKEIEDWNKEAQKGVLFGDSKMTTLLSNLRTSMMGKTDVSDLVLANIGISPAFMDTSGKLVFDEKKFKEILLEKPDEIASLFTGSKEDGKPGLAVQLREVFTKNIGMLGTSGILIEEAGLDTGLSSDQNNISKKIKEHDDKMESLRKSLEKERQRYWNQFTALEKTLSELNAQSSWLTDMMG